MALWRPSAADPIPDDPVSPLVVIEPAGGPPQDAPGAEPRPTANSGMASAMGSAPASGTAPATPSPAVAGYRPSLNPHEVPSVRVAAPLSRKRERILIVGLEAHTTGVATQILRREKYEVITADTGQEALIALKLSLQKFSLILCQLKLSDMMAPDMLKHMRTDLRENVPFVVMAVHANHHTLDHCIAQGVADFIQAPFSTEVLKTRVRLVLRSEAQSILNERLQAQVQELSDENGVLQNRVDDLSAKLASLEAYISDNQDVFAEARHQRELKEERDRVNDLTNALVAQRQENHYLRMHLNFVYARMCVLEDLIVHQPAYGAAAAVASAAGSLASTSALPSTAHLASPRTVGSNSRSLSSAHIPTSMGRAAPRGRNSKGPTMYPGATPQQLEILRSEEGESARIEVGRLLEPPMMAMVRAMETVVNLTGVRNGNGIFGSSEVQRLMDSLAIVRSALLYAATGAAYTAPMSVLDDVTYLDSKTKLWIAHNLVEAGVESKSGALAGYEYSQNRAKSKQHRRRVSEPVENQAQLVKSIQRNALSSTLGGDRDGSAGSKGSGSVKVRRGLPAVNVDATWIAMVEARFDYTLTPQIKAGVSSPLYSALEIKEHLIPVVVQHIFVELSLNRRFRVPLTTLQALVVRVMELYPTYPFHNFRRALDMLLSVFSMVQNTSLPGFLTHLDVLVLFLASLGSGIAHPGLTNSFLVRTRHELAMRYNDHLPAENNSCAELFAILERPECAILESLSWDEEQEVRFMVTEAIMSTNPINHHSILTRLAAQKLKPNPRRQSLSLELRRLMVAATMHFASVAVLCKGPALAARWIEAQIEEYTAQGLQERELELPHGPFCDGASSNGPELAVTLLELVVHPILQQLSFMVLGLDPYFPQLNAARETFEEPMARKSRPAPSERGRRGSTATSAYGTESVSRLGEEYGMSTAGSEREIFDDETDSENEWGDGESMDLDKQVTAQIRPTMERLLESMPAAVRGIVRSVQLPKEEAKAARARERQEMREEAESTGGSTLGSGLASKKWNPSMSLTKTALPVLPALRGSPLSWRGVGKGTRPGTTPSPLPHIDEGGADEA